MIGLWSTVALSASSLIIICLTHSTLDTLFNTFFLCESIPAENSCWKQFLTKSCTESEYKIWNGTADHILLYSVSTRCTKPHVKLVDFSFKIDVYHMEKSLAALSYNTSKQRNILLGVVSVSGSVGRRFKSRLRHAISSMKSLPWVSYSLAYYSVSRKEGLKMVRVALQVL